VRRFLVAACNRERNGHVTEHDGILLGAGLERPLKNLEALVDATTPLQELAKVLLRG
jgi:hypothetical protein